MAMTREERAADILHRYLNFAANGIAIPAEARTELRDCVQLIVDAAVSHTPAVMPSDSNNSVAGDVFRKPPEKSK